MSELLSAYLPEFIILIFIILNLIFSLFSNTATYKMPKWFSILGIIAALFSTIYLQIDPEAFAFNNMFLTNIYTVFFKILILISGFFVVLLSRNMIREKRDRAAEYFCVFLSGLLFAMCAVSPFPGITGNPLANQPIQEENISEKKNTEEYPNYVLLAL